MNDPDLSFPADYEEWPDGGEVLARVIRTANPALSFADLRPVADRLLTGPGLTISYTPAPGQTPRVVLTDEAVTVCMLVQAWSDRADAALAQCSDDDALGRCVLAVRVIRSATRYLSQLERA